MLWLDISMTIKIANFCAIAQIYYVYELTCSTLISPLYMNSMRHLISANLQSFMMTMGSLSEQPFVRMESKYVLQAHKTTRCAFSVCPSQANVTSQKHPRSNSCENIVCKLLWWYFHRRQYCCGLFIVCPPLFNLVYLVVVCSNS